MDLLDLIFGTAMAAYLKGFIEAPDDNPIGK